MIAGAILARLMTSMARADSAGRPQAITAGSAGPAAQQAQKIGGEMSENPLATMQKLDPEFLDHLKKTNRLIFEDGALPKKIKLLIALAFDAAYGAEGGVQSLAKAATAEGATEKEITEALRVAYHLSGVGTIYTASRALTSVFE